MTTQETALARWCRENDVSYHQLGKAIQCDFSMVSRLARRITFPKRETAAALVKETGLPVTEIVGISDAGELADRAEERSRTHRKRQRRANGK